MAEESRTIKMRAKDYQRDQLERFAQAYVRDQIIQKKANEGWGDVTIKMTFQKGMLIQAELTDRTVVRPENLDPKVKQAAD
jgi:hypothetical protein